MFLDNDKELEYLPDGSIDYSKLDPGNDFRMVPKLFNSWEDIWKFIVSRDKQEQFTLLRLMVEETEHIWHEDERKQYMDSFFDYIYDVYRFPTEDTYGKVVSHLTYLQSKLVYSGVTNMISHFYDIIRIRVDTDYFIIQQEYGIKNKDPIINCHELPNNTDKYYIAHNGLGPNVIEQFWVRSTPNSGQPETINGLSYMRVWVFENRVRIFGCDDCSWGMNGTKKEVDLLVHTLKTKAKVWSFNYASYINPKLEFTN